MLISPSLLGILPQRVLGKEFSIVTDIALAIIAYSIGGSLKVSNLKGLGKSISWITISQALGAFVLTFIPIFTLSRYFLGTKIPHASFLEIYLPLALIIGAVSTATAPATILAIIHEYEAKGPLTTVALGVVALDDGVAIILYAFAGNIVVALRKAGGISLYNMAIEPLIIIMGSLLLGTIFGFLLIKITAWIKRKESLLVVILGGIFLCTGICAQLNLSPLLANLMLGFFAVNKARHCQDLFRAIEENIEELIFVLFFTLAGAHINLAVMKISGFLALIITISRFSGKILGAKLGAGFSHAPEVVTKYLGYTLLPIAGVAMGLILLGKSLMASSPLVAEIMVNAVLGSIMISELIAPPLVKFIIIRSGEGVKE
jgi:NhaP-type Na+/H+ or K+/H+ antiporter